MFETQGEGKLLQDEGGDFWDFILPLELQATMPDYMIPFVPIIHEDEKPFAMFQDLKQTYGDWVLDVLQYDSADNFLKVLDKAGV
jgi:hypothetical protein